MSQSSDSVFNAAASEEHSTVYSTLCHLLVAVSPAFAAWYKQHVEEGDRTEKFSLEEILDSLPTLASNTIPSQHWFASSQDDTVSVELLHQAAQLLAGETLPYLSSDVTPAPNWLQEYNLVKDQVDAELQPQSFCLGGGVLEQLSPGRRHDLRPVARRHTAHGRSEDMGGAVADLFHRLEIRGDSLPGDKETRPMPPGFRPRLRRRRSKSLPQTGGLIRRRRARGHARQHRKHHHSGT